MSAWAKFPSFESVFAKSDVARVPLYLSLLRPSGDAGLAVTDIKRCIQRSGPNLTPELKEMLAQRNWRLHLVAAVALLVAGATKDEVEVLWGAIRRPSWVSPQLAATASSLDPRFAERARLMIERRCSFDEKQLVDMDWIERHHALGPSSYQSHSAKILASLVALCALRGEPPWLEALKSAADIRTILASDVDAGGEIAVQWITRITPLIGHASGR